MPICRHAASPSNWCKSAVRAFGSAATRASSGARSGAISASFSAGGVWSGLSIVRASGA